jgi:hypothetical protein
MHGTERIPAAGALGSKQKDAPDFATSLIAAQLKKGYAFPGYLKTWLEGIKKAGAQAGLIGIVIWQSKGQRDLDSLVCLRLEDWLTLLRRAGLAPAEAPPSETEPDPASGALTHSLAGSTPER